MAQIVYPISDAEIGDWRTNNGDTADLFERLADSDPATYIESGLFPTDDPYVAPLGPLDPPASDDGWVLRIELGKSANGATQVDVLVELREAYVDEGSLGTLIASDTFEDVAEGLTTVTLEPTSGEVATITDVTDLYVRITASQVEIP
jgi:hypothetical protein